MSKSEVPKPWQWNGLVVFLLASVISTLIGNSYATSLAPKEVRDLVGLSGTKTIRSPQLTTSSQAVITITAGVNHQFIPENVTANVGDIIIWRFYPREHSVVHGDYRSPCVPIEMMNPGIDNSKKWWSGLITVDKVPTKDEEFITFWKRINDTEPIFYYCSSAGSCTDWHMVGVINPNATYSLEMAKRGAESARFQLNPGEPFPLEGAVPRPSSSSRSNSSSTASGGNSSGNSKGVHLSTPKIVLISISVVVILLFIGLLFFILGRRKGSLRWGEGGGWARWFVGNNNPSSNTGVEGGKGIYFPGTGTVPMTPGFEHGIASPPVTPYSAYSSYRTSIISPPMVQGSFQTTGEPVELYGQVEPVELDAGSAAVEREGLLKGEEGDEEGDKKGKWKWKKKT